MLVVLLPGTGEPAETWGPIADALAAEGYQVRTPDLPGSGTRADAPGPHSVDSLADEVAATLDGEPVHLVGYSLGGYVAEELARHHPARVRTLALLGSAGRSTAYGRLRAAAALEVDPPPRPVEVVDLLTELLSRRQLQEDDALVERAAGAFGSGEQWQGPGRLGQLRASVDWFARPDPLGLLARIQVPTLLMAFSDDIWHPPARVREAAAAMSRATYVELEDCGHGGPVLRSAEVAEHLVAFFGTN